MKRGAIIIGIVIAVVVVAGVAVFMTRGDGEEVTPTPIPAPTPAPTSTPEEVKVPVNLQGARGVGSLHVELVYDSAVLEATGVEAGNLGRNALIEYNLEIPGRVIVGIVDAMGIDGDGTVVTVSFKVVANEGTSPLSLEHLEATDAETLYDIITEVSPGEFVAKDRSFTPPVVTFTE